MTGRGGGVRRSGHRPVSSDTSGHDDDHDGTPARGKVGTGVDRETLTVAVGDETHEYGFAAVRGATYDGRTCTVCSGASLKDEQATWDQVTRRMPEVMGNRGKLARVPAGGVLQRQVRLRDVGGVGGARGRDDQAAVARVNDEAGKASWRVRDMGSRCRTYHEGDDAPHACLLLLVVMRMPDGKWGAFRPLRDVRG
ncbi:hypothetical protein ACFC8N_06155 [Streptomyces sp. NPDC055966]|uniref:hypothetical protein n=1 Tax=Streptomyces sp. NPDC055966 TaxID=3345669 RepID=UPI0035E27201